MALALGACSGSANRAISGSVGVSNGVVLTTPGNGTTIYVGSTLDLFATVTNDVNGAGVTWSITGGGSLTSQTTSSAIWIAPSTAIGAAEATVIATSIANPSQTAQVTLIALGSPVINNAPVLFPANQNVAYSATISVSGGVSPFGWSVVSGALPAGLALSSSTASLASISGTPTTLGHYTFTLQAVDADSRTATIALAMDVNAETGCLLQGQYAYLYSGYWNNQTATAAGSLTVSSTGTVTGIQDYKDAGRATAAEALTGTCTTSISNNGTITLSGPVSGTITLNYAATAPDATTGKIRSARMVLVSAGSNSGSGLLQAQIATAFALPTLIGNFALGTLGADSTGAHVGLAARLSTDATGTLSSGEADLNGSAPLTAAPLTGSFTAPDANGRGTASLLAGGLPLNLAYYIVNANKLFLVDVDGASGTPWLAGFMTPQSGSFDATSLASATGILSLWGNEGITEPVAVLAMGRLSNGNAAAGTVDLLLDTASHANITTATAITGASYAVAADGRGTLSFADLGLTRSFVFYLDGAADGYVLEQGSSSGNAGMLEAQSGPITDTINGAFVLGTQFAASRSPISLIPAVTFNYGALSSSYASGTFALDATSGRGLGTWTQTSVGTTAAVIYLVRHCDPTVGTCDPNLPDKINMLRFGARGLDPSIEWLTH
jgi:hypothetical protein